jgi:hypothetical protein
MKAKLKDYYRKATGIVYVYTLTATDAEKEALKKAKGTYYREDENGNPLFFSSRPLSFNRNEAITMNITANGKIVADDLNKVLSQEDKLEEYILQEKAKIMAQRALAGGGLQAVAKLIPTADRSAQDIEIEEVPDEFINNIPENVHVADEIPA